MVDNNSPDLWLIVRTTDRTAKTWVLEPQGKNTFRVIVVCTPQEQEVT